MGVTDFCYDCVRGVGQFIGGTVWAVASCGRVLSESASTLRPTSSIDKIRQVVLTELRRLRGEKADVSSAKLEERLEIMAQTILALQKRIEELGERGSVSEATLMEAMGSVKAAESLNEDERTLLMTVFQKNIALQRPEMMETVVDLDTAE